MMDICQKEQCTGCRACANICAPKAVVMKYDNLGKSYAVIDSDKCIQYNNIDLFEFIFAIIVVIIHTTPLKDISETANWYFLNTLGNLAVPFFFMASGFLLFKKLNDGCDDCNKAVKKYLIHIMRMYLVWCVIWIPWKVLHYYNLGTFTIVDFAEYVRNIIFVSGGDALWYLPALATAVGIVYLLRYKLNVPKAVVLIASSVLYVVGCLISSWYGIFADSLLVQNYYSIFVSVENGVLYGMMFVALGMSIAESKKEHSIVFNAVGFIFLFFLMAVESNIISRAELNRGVCNNIFLPCTAFFMFKLILSINIKGDGCCFSKLRAFSTLIYLCHCFIIRSVKLFAGIFGINIPHIVLFIIVLILSLAFAVFVRGINKKYKWVKLLY